ncbi:hypothetical protein AB6A40_009848 [Gnathostoma spinigerum]|uniref:Uncharacterized protein n=1 Tax=Gnathostoma spinigerum TaxID=75299 RepID=A0ABD6EYB3_9BILA
MRGMKFDLIVLDPPWANRSVKRKNPYVVAGGERDLFGLEIAQLLSGNGLVAMWITNRTLILETIETIFDEWGVQKVATWCWLKVTKTGDPVCSFKFHHKVPFERIVFACRPEDVHIHSKSLADNFLLISTPCGIHSRKPPLLPILQSLNVIGNSSCLELFSRNLLPNTVSIGYEVTKFQNVAWFDKR